MEDAASWDSQNAWLCTQNEAIFALLDSMATTLAEAEAAILDDELLEEAQLPSVDPSRLASYDSAAHR